MLIPAAIRSDFERALSGNPQDIKNLTILSRLLLKLERWPEAQVALEKMLMAEPDSANHLTNLGLALAKQGQFTLAITHLKMALKLQPNHAEAQRNLTVLRRLVDKGN